jgi:hypothetical protein
MDTYYGGEGRNLGLVSALTQGTFSDLVKQVFGHPVALPLTRAQFHALPKKDTKVGRDQDRAKRTRFVIPGVIPGTTERRSSNVTCCNLVFLDVDDSTQASLILAELDYMTNTLAPFSYAVYHTASSTPAKPRLRVVVSADQIAPQNYPKAVSFVANMLGMDEVTSESRVVCQPMFLPVMFRDDDPETDHPLIRQHLSGRALTAEDIGETPLVGIANKANTPDVGIAEVNLDHLKAPVEEITAADMGDILGHLDPDMDRKQWISIGAALKHQFGEDGKEIWRNWSSDGEKYAGDEEVDTQWRSMKATPQGRVPVTIRTVMKLAKEGGWSSDKVASKCFQSVNQWIGDEDRTETELMKDAIPRIVATPLLTHVERGALLSKLIASLKKLDVKISRTDLTRELRKAERATRGKGGDDDEPDESKMPMWAQDITFVSQNNEFYKTSTGQRWSVDALNNTFSVKMMTTAEEGTARPAMLPHHFMLNQLAIPRVDHYLYDPAHPNKIHVQFDKRLYINTYRATYPEADPRQSAEAGAILEAHAKLLFGDTPEAVLLLDWMAFLVQSLGEKVLWAPLLQGAEGCGKTLFPYVLRLVLGESNVKEVGPNVVIHSDWNEWAADCQLVVLEEVRVVGEARHAVMNKLKPLITNTHIAINQRNKDTRVVPNYANYLLTSNFTDALAITENDRRYFVLFAKQQSKTDVRAIGSAYFSRVYDTLKTMGGGLRAYLLERRISPEFNPNLCPDSAAKKLLIDAACSPLHRAVTQALADGDSPLVRRDVASTRALRDIIEVDNRGLGRFSDQALSSVLRELGYTAVGRVRIAQERHYLWAKDCTPEEAQQLVIDRSNGLDLL